MMKATKLKSSKRKKLEAARKKIKRHNTQKKERNRNWPTARQIAINAMRQRNFPDSTQMRKEIANYSVT